MKKMITNTIFTFAISAFCLLAAPFTVSAGKLETPAAEVKEDVITVSGKAEKDVLAVAVLVYDEKDELVCMETGEAADGSYSLKLSQSFAAGSYTVKVADYEGGEFASVKATVEEKKTDDETDDKKDDKEEGPGVMKTEKDANGNEQQYWYENGIKQGTEGRGKEIYDPKTNAWYWLDAVQGGAVAKDKDVYQESNGGKWVRYDENGKMIKGEDFRYGGWYYFEEITGAMQKGFVTLADGRKVYYDPINGQMAKGEVEIEGKTYVFDAIYGSLKTIDGKAPDETAGDKMWLTVDGKRYWYEGWKKQGWNPASRKYRGKEIYDPESDAWYWLDNVNQGGMAASKDVYMESEAGPWGEKVDETTGKRIGKWVRYDENGHMVKGWDTNKKGTYYFDLIYGTMAKGKVTIDGEEYEFDLITGIKK